MYASLRTYRIKTGSIDDLMHRVDRDFAEAMAQEPGFISYQAIQTGERAIMTLSIFRTQEQAEASNELAAEWVGENLGDFDIERMGVIGGEVMVARANVGALEPAHH